MAERALSRQPSNSPTFRWGNRGPENGKDWLTSHKNPVAAGSEPTEGHLCVFRRGRSLSLTHQCHNRENSF